MNNISCLLCGEKNNLQKTLLNTVESYFPKKDIYFIDSKINTRICDYNSLKDIADKSSNEYLMLVTNASNIHLMRQAIHRFSLLADMSGANMLFSDYNEFEREKPILHPLADYHIGCVRDDFALGDILFIRTSALKKALSKINPSLQYSAIYALRLEFMKSNSIEHIPEPLYTLINKKTKSSNEDIFDYVNPTNRDVQIEMEAVFTHYLKDIGAYIEPKQKEIELNKEVFKTEASVIIPVRDRAKTITEAIESVMSQKCDFPFNLIVVDNHSSDGTTKIIKKLKVKYDNIIHLIPESNTLGIGGCWNLGINHPECGKFAIQLDSDDVYNTPFTIEKVVKSFYENSCAMLIGSYEMMDFNNQPIAPGLIDHKEWTPENGANNALRINGLGAPRAFYTPIIRELLLPNTSYGEDYAVGLALSRQYKIGRILDPIYNCRRWDGNSDANLDICKLNSYNAYKDRLRYFEIKKRILMNK